MLSPDATTEGAKRTPRKTVKVEKPEKKTEEDRSTMAFVLAQDYVKRALKSPRQLISRGLISRRKVWVMGFIRFVHTSMHRTLSELRSDTAGKSDCVIRAKGKTPIRQTGN